MSDLLKGAYDLHVHTGPDVVARKCSDLELADRMRAVMTKPEQVSLSLRTLTSSMLLSMLTE